MKPVIPNLYHELEHLLQQIPCGKVTRLSDLATSLGDPLANRWLSRWLQDPAHHVAGCACHRVLPDSGELGEYVTGNLDDKLQQLWEEGISFENGVVDWQQFGFAEFHATFPLKRLRDSQENLRKQIELIAFPETPELMAGVDVSYGAGRQAVGGYALVETATGKLVWSVTVEREITFPYITGFLAYRELPILLELIELAEAAGKLADVILVDGNGILHQRRAGVASHLGVLSHRATIGVGKKLLCGDVDLEQVTGTVDQPVTQRGSLLGMAMKADDHNRPVFVSPGHLITVTDAARLTRLLFHGHRLPEPLYQADSLSRKILTEPT